MAPRRFRCRRIFGSAAFSRVAAAPETLGCIFLSSTAAGAAGAPPAAPPRSNPASPDDPADTGSCRRNPPPRAAPWRTASRSSRQQRRRPHLFLRLRVRVLPIRLGTIRLGTIRLGNIRLGNIRLGNIRLGTIRLRNRFLRARRAGPRRTSVPARYRTTSRSNRRCSRVTRAAARYTCDHRVTRLRLGTDVPHQRAHDHRETVCGKSGFGGIGPGHEMVYTPIPRTMQP